MKYSINILSKVNADTVDQLTSLIVQLNPDFTPPASIQDVRKAIESENTLIFIAKNDQGTIIAMVSLCWYPHLEGKVKAWIEDLVVDKDHRRLGIAQQLMQKAINQAKKMGFKYIYLTSRPSRHQANTLYQQKFHFEKYNTNVYQLKLK